MENPLTTLKELKERFLKREPDSVIGVDVGSSAIKVVELKRRKGVAVLETYGEIALGPYAGVEIGQATKLPVDEVTRALIDVMREANVVSRTGGISIPFTSSLVTMISMPSMPAKDLQKMIPLEARKYIPVPPNEVSLDWFIVPQGEEAILSGTRPQADTKTFAESTVPSSGKINVLLVAIHNDVLSMYQTLVEGASLDVSFFEIEIFSAIRATIGQTLAPVAVLDFGAAKTKLYIVEYGVVKASHLINRGSQDLTLSLSRSTGISVGEAEKEKRTNGLDIEGAGREALMIPLEYIFGEVNRVLLAYERKYGRNIGRLILTGGGSVLKGLLPLSKDKLETDVILGDPFAKTETPAFLADVLRQVGPEFSVAVGLALRKLQESNR